MMGIHEVEIISAVSTIKLKFLKPIFYNLESKLDGLSRLSDKGGLE
jgi:hypothetical protein